MPIDIFGDCTDSVLGKRGPGDQMDRQGNVEKQARQGSKEEQAHQAIKENQERLAHQVEML